MTNTYALWWEKVYNIPWDNADTRQCVVTMATECGTVTTYEIGKSIKLQKYWSLEIPYRSRSSGPSRCFWIHGDDYLFVFVISCFSSFSRFLTFPHEHLGEIEIKCLSKSNTQFLLGFIQGIHKRTLSFMKAYGDNHNLNNQKIYGSEEDTLLL